MQQNSCFWGFGLFCAAFLPVGATAQELICHHTQVTDLGLLSQPGKTNYNLRISGTLQYSLTGSLTLLVNPQKTTGVNQFFLLQDLKYSSLFEDNGRVRITNIFIHNLGLQVFFDSITRFQRDENILTTRVDISAGSRWAFNFTSILSTRLFNDYNILVTDSGARLRILNAGFLTPLFWNFSTGITLYIRQTGRLILGISAAKLTYILNRQVYREQGIDTFFGVPESKGYSFEYGVALQLLVDRDILKRIHWNCDILLFKNTEKPVDMALKNIFTFRISKFLQVNIQTRLFYEEEVSKSLRIENLVSLGFYFHL